MAYRKFKADYLFTGTDMLDNNHVLITTGNGTVQDIIPSIEAGEDIEVFDDILSPGFINCHCHLELSHLKGIIPQKTGLVDFVFAVVTQRHFPEEEIYNAISKAEDEMLNNGIIAVGDICNNTHTIAQKEKQRLTYFNFIEVSGWLPQLADARFARSKMFYDEFEQLSNSRPRIGDTVQKNLSMAAHAPYSVSNELWELIVPYFSGQPTTIHNQESRFENELFQSGTGDFRRMYELMNIDNKSFQPTGRSSLQSYLPKLKKAKNIILVHNTFISEADLEFSQSINPGTGHISNQLFFCLCAQANLYIENTLPPIELLRNYHCNIVVGTDSLASNQQLDILSEIKTISAHFPAIPLAELLRWCTINGAKALQLDDKTGSFAPGKQPGVVLIKNTNKQNLTAQSIARRII